VRLEGFFPKNIAATRPGSRRPRSKICRGGGCAGALPFYNDDLEHFQFCCGAADVDTFVVHDACRRRHVGDLSMSLIYTCQLNQANSFDYLTQLQKHTEQLAAVPELWMPCNYRAALA
jgi:hypothetical protein